MSVPTFEDGLRAMAWSTEATAVADDDAIFRILSEAIPPGPPILDPEGDYYDDDWDDDDWDDDDDEDDHEPDDYAEDCYCHLCLGDGWDEDDDE